MANQSKLPEQWRKSGLSQREFCERKGISLATFSYWRSKELRANGANHDSSAGSAFAEVVVERPTDSGRYIEINYPDGTHIRLPLPSC